MSPDRTVGSLQPEPEEPALTPGGPASNGLEIPADIFDWRVIGAVDHESDAGGIRVVVGNDTAVEAARAGRTNPWPDGSMLAHYVWADGDNPYVFGLVAPGAFNALTLMVKNSQAYADDGGWAYANWTGENLDPNPMENFDRGCVGCHTDNAAGNDYVFTRVGALPSRETVAGAAAAPNRLLLPVGFLDWRVIGVANPADDTLRVIVGNDTAVEAARSGQTNPWPDGSVLGHFVWADSQNPLIENAVVPGAFRAITLMRRDGERYGDDGGWAFGVWEGPDLTPPDEPNFDQACIACHTLNVSNNDYVFTLPGKLPGPIADLAP